MDEHKWPSFVTSPKIDPTGEYFCGVDQGKCCRWCDCIHFGSVHCPHSPAASKEKPWPKHEVGTVGARAEPAIDRGDEVRAHRDYPKFVAIVNKWFKPGMPNSGLAVECLYDYASLPSPAPQFQSRVLDWMKRCFVRPDGSSPEQRAFRFIEEAIELVQAAGTSREDVLRLVDYVYSRPAGTVAQEVGGVMVTLAGVATAFDVNLTEVAEAELARCESNTERIRAKDLAKPQRSPLPRVASPVQPVETPGEKEQL